MQVMRMFDVERLGSIGVIAMPRRLGLTNVRGLITCVRGELEDGTTEIVLDLRETDAIDMTALAGIVDMYKQCASRGVELRLRAPRESVRRLLSITRLDRFFRVDCAVDSEEMGAAAE